MNILVVCHYGLYENLSFSFVHNQIREYVKLGCRVRVVIPNAWGKRDRTGRRFGKSLCVSRVDGVELYDLRYLTLSTYGEKWFNTWQAIGSIRLHFGKIFHNFKPDLIHAHTLGFDSEIGAWLKQRFSCELVVTTHGSDSEVLLANGEANRLKGYCDHAGRIVAVSSKLAEKVKTCGTKVDVVSVVNGFVSRDCDETILRDPMRIIQVGNLVASKKTDVTIRAFAMLKRTYPEMKLVIVGAGPERSMLEALCRELKIDSDVTFLGQLSNERVFCELQKSTFFVMVSKPEGFGIVYLEAMAAGCVTLGTEDQGICDVIQHEKNGFLLPADDPKAIADTIDRCLCEAELIKSVSASGRNAVKMLTWKENAKKYLQLFKSNKERRFDGADKR